MSCCFQGSNDSTPPDTFLGTHEQIRDEQLPISEFDHVFLAAAALHTDDNQAIDTLLRSHPNIQVRMFVVIPPPLYVGDQVPAEGVQHETLWAPPEKTDGACQPATQEATKAQTGPEMAAPDKPWTTDLDANQRALLLGNTPMEATAAPPSPRKSLSSRPTPLAEMGDVLSKATAAAVMEEASHVAVVREDRTSFVHRSRVMMDHLVLVRSSCALLFVCDSSHASSTRRCRNRAETD